MELAAAPANIGVLPVPTELGIDLAIVAGDLAKAKDHTQNADKTQADKKRCWTLHDPAGIGIADNRAQGCRSPKNSKEDSESP